MQLLKKRLMTAVVAILIIAVVSSALAITLRLNQPEEEPVVSSDFGALKGTRRNLGLYFNHDETRRFNNGYPLSVVDISGSYGNVFSTSSNYVGKVIDTYISIEVNPGADQAPRIGRSIYDTNLLEPPTDTIKKLLPEVGFIKNRLVVEFDFRLDSLGSVTGTGDNFLRIDVGRDYGSSNSIGSINFNKVYGEEYFIISDLSFENSDMKSSPKLDYCSWYNIRLEYFQYEDDELYDYSMCLVFVNDQFVGEAKRFSTEVFTQAKTTSIVPRQYVDYLSVSIDNYFVGRDSSILNFSESE